MVTDSYSVNSALAPTEKAALALTDLIIGMPRAPDAELRETLQNLFSQDELVELCLGVGLFMGMSKVLITLGLEPEDMATTVIPSPGSASPE